MFVCNSEKCSSNADLEQLSACVVCSKHLAHSTAEFAQNLGTIVNRPSFLMKFKYLIYDTGFLFFSFSVVVIDNAQLKF